MWQYLTIALLLSYILILRTQINPTPSKKSPDSSTRHDEKATQPNSDSSGKKASRKPQKSLLNSIIENAIPASYKLKQVIILRRDLGMGTGKLVAQGAHASVGCVNLIQKSNEKQWSDWKGTWERMGTAKIALKVQSEEELQDLRRQAQEAGLPYYLVQDAGRTQVASGSVTALAIGPAPVDKIDAIAGKLKLL